MVGLLGLVLGVGGFGLAADAILPGANPKLFVAVGYPVLAAGPPALVSDLAGERPALRVSGLAVVGQVAATGVDLGLVGVVQAPPRIVVHRIALATAFGTARVAILPTPLIDGL